MEERNYGSYEPREPGPGPGGKKDFEDKLDEIADKVSQTVSDGVRRLEDTVSNMQKQPEVSEGKIRDLFSSPLGGLIVIAAGLLWFFNAVGLFDNKILPVILIAVGIYMMVRANSSGARR